MQVEAPSCYPLMKESLYVSNAEAKSMLEFRCRFAEYQCYQ